MILNCMLLHLLICGYTGYVSMWYYR